jgi:ribosome-associated protein
VEGYLEISRAVSIPRAELTWRFSRSSGPGGQSVNTADSRVELRFDLAGTAALPAPLKERALARLGPRLVDGAVVVTAAEHRSQLQNRRAAEARLVALLSAAIAPPAPGRRPTRPTRGSVQRRIDTKKHRGQTKRLRRAPDE